MLKENVCVKVACSVGIYLRDPMDRIILKDICMRQNLSSVFDSNCPQNWRIPFPTNVRELHIPHILSNHQAFSYTAIKTCIGTINVQFLDMSHNFETMSTFTVQNNINKMILDCNDNHITDADFSYNKVYFENLNILKSFTKLKKLRISGNLFSNNSLSDMCRYFPNLETLVIKDSNIVDMQDESFSECKNLNFLDISSNNLRKVALSQLPKLKMLNLQDNQISILSEEFTRSIKAMGKAFVNLTNNQFNCTCNHESLDAVKRLQQISHKVIDFERMTCLTAQGYYFINQINTEEIRDLCFPTVIPYVITAVVTFVGTCVSLFLMRLFYMRRYHIKTLIYRLKYRKRMRANTTDFYLMYCRKDKDWVHYVLLDKLEQTYKFNTVVPDRDFGAGYHVDELLTFLTRCHAYLLVLSENFIMDIECRHDMAFAFDYRRRYGKPLVIVKMGPIGRQCAAIDPKIREMLSAKDYVALPQKFSCDRVTQHSNQLKEEQFWCKLTSKLYKTISSQTHIPDEGDPQIFNRHGNEVEIELSTYTDADETEELVDDHNF